MVKFGKYLVQNRVPEWEAAYLRYKKLKKTLKQIRRARALANANDPNATTNANLEAASSRKKKRKKGPVDKKTAEALALSSAVWAKHHLHPELGGDGAEMDGDSTEADSQHTSNTDGRASRQQQTNGTGSDADSRRESGSDDGEREQRRETDGEGSGSENGFLRQPAPIAARSPTRSSSSVNSSAQQTELLKMVGSSTFRMLSMMDEGVAESVQQAAFNAAPPPPYEPRASNSQHSMDGSEIELANVPVSAPASAISPQPTPALAPPSDASDRSSPSHEGDADNRSGSVSVSLPPIPSPSPSVFPGNMNGHRRTSNPLAVSFRGILPPSLRNETYERIFFEILEEDLNRINSFFKSQEQFFLTKVDILSKQIHAFLHQDANEAPQLRPAGSAQNGTGSGTEAEAGAQSGQHQVQGSESTSGDGSATSDGTKSSSKSKLKKMSPKSLMHSKKQQSQSRASYKAALAKAVQELYRGLNLLKNFRILNFTGLVKILKKHDKNSSYPLSKEILPIIQACYFFRSPILEQFLERVEALYVSTFCGGDRKSGMEVLRPRLPPLSSWLIFSLGFTVGLCLILLTIFAGLMHVGLMETDLIPNQIIAIAPVFRCLFLILLAAWLWGAVVHQFQRHQLNYEFILDIDWSNHLTFPQILWIACIGSLIYFVALDVYLILLLSQQHALSALDPSDPDGSVSADDHDIFMSASTAESLQPGYVHLSMWLVFICMMLCPFNYFFRSTRKYLLRGLVNIWISPFAPVTFLSFYLADQLCSLVSVFGDLSYAICFYASGDFLTNSSARCAHTNSRYVMWFVAFLPYWWRLMQCFRRYRDNRIRRDLYNAAKYSTSIIVTFASLLDKYYPHTAFRPVWILCAIISTTYSYLWDIRCDWGLISWLDDKASADPWLRPKLTLENRGWYWFAIVSNLLLRIVWVFTISPAYQDLFVHNDVKLFVVYSLEIVRRAQWNYYRLENEHLNNVGQFRAVNIVPIPHLSVMNDEEVAERFLKLNKADTNAAKQAVEQLLAAEPDVLKRMNARKSLTAQTVATPATNGTLQLAASASPSLANGSIIGASVAARKKFRTSPPVAGTIIESEEHEEDEDVDEMRHVDAIEVNMDRDVERANGEELVPVEKRHHEGSDGDLSLVRLHLHASPSPSPESDGLALSSSGSGRAAATPLLHPSDVPPSVAVPVVPMQPSAISTSSNNDFCVDLGHNTGDSDSSSDDSDDDEEEDAGEAAADAMAREARRQERREQRRERRRRRREAAEAEAALDDDGDTTDHATGGVSEDGSMPRVRSHHSLRRRGSHSIVHAMAHANANAATASPPRKLSGRGASANVSRNSSAPRLQQLLDSDDYDHDAATYPRTHSRSHSRQASMDNSNAPRRNRSSSQLSGLTTRSRASSGNTQANVPPLHRSDSSNVNKRATPHTPRVDAASSTASCSPRDPSAAAAEEVQRELELAMVASLAPHQPANQIDPDVDVDADADVDSSPTHQPTSP